MEFKSFVSGLLAGAAVGAAIGILMAPASGEQTRKKLSKGAQRLSDDLSVAVEGTVDSLKETFSREVGKAVSDLKAAADVSSKKANG